MKYLALIGLLATGSVFFIKTPTVETKSNIKTEDILNKPKRCTCGCSKLIDLQPKKTSCGSH